MTRQKMLVTVVLVAFAVVVGAPRFLLAQPSLSRLISVSGVYQPADGTSPAGVEAVTLAVYADESDHIPLWQETQSVEVGPSGRYTLLLGATEATGIPLGLFASGEARWFGMMWGRPGEVEGPRTRLTSVPYALSASNAETLGGKPASAYVLAPAAGGGSASLSNTTPEGDPAPSAVNPGTTNFLAKYLNAADVGNSAVFESGGFVGVNTTTPFDVVHARFTNTGGTMTGYAVQNLGNTAASYSGMLFYDQNNALAQFQGFNNVTHEYRINNVARTSPMGPFDGSINFMIGSTSRLFVGSDGHVGIGTTVTPYKLEVLNSSFYGLRVQTDLEGGTVASFGGRGNFLIDAPGNPGGRFVAKESGRIGIGMPLIGDGPAFKLHVIDGTSNTGLRVENGAAGGTVASFGNNGAFHIDAPGSPGGRFVVREDGFTGIGTAFPGSRLEVGGVITVQALGADGATPLCRNASNQISTCASSMSVTSNVTPAHSDPSENLLLITAINEQQARITRQQAEIDALKALICADHPTAAVCQSY